MSGYLPPRAALPHLHHVSGDGWQPDDDIPRRSEVYFEARKTLPVPPMHWCRQSTLGRVNLEGKKRVTVTVTGQDKTRHAKKTREWALLRRLGSLEWTCCPGPGPLSFAPSSFCLAVSLVAPPLFSSDHPPRPQIPPPAATLVISDGFSFVRLGCWNPTPFNRPRTDHHAHPTHPTPTPPHTPPLPPSIHLLAPLRLFAGGPA
jgi:hypothetical protein